MKEHSVFLCVVFAAMLAVAGCGDSSDGEGGNGGNGSGGNGSGGNGSASACEALCGSSCVFEQVDPGDDFEACVSSCETVYTGCQEELGTWVACFESIECKPEQAASCADETLAWVNCVAPGGIL